MNKHHDMVAFLSALVAGYPPNAHLTQEIRPLHPVWRESLLYPNGDAPAGWACFTGARRWLSLSDTQRSANIAAGLADRYEVYVGVLPRTVTPNVKPTGGASVCQWAAWLFADIDGGEAGPDACIAHLAGVCSAGKLPPPHMVVVSGGGAHIYWQLAQAVPLPDAQARERFKRLLQRLTQIIGSRDNGVHADSAASEVARVLRVPGTFNHKRRREPRPVLLRHHDLSGTRYAFAEWEAFTQVPAPTPPRSERRIDPCAPDEYVRFLRWAQQGYPEGSRHQDLAGAGAWLVRDCGVPKSVARELLLMKAQASAGTRCITPSEVEDIVTWA